MAHFIDHTKNASSYLIIDVVCQLATYNLVDSASIALFVDTTANALAAATMTGAYGSGGDTGIRYNMGTVLFKTLCFFGQYIGKNL